MSIIKSDEDLKNLRHSCRILMSCHHHLEKLIRPGISGRELNEFAINFGKKHDAVSNFLGYRGFKYAITLSIDDEVVHGFPSEDKIIPENGLVKIDMGFIYKGMHSDAAKTYIVGSPGKDVEKMVKVTEEALWAGIEQVKSGCRVGDVGSVVDEIARKNAYGNVKQLTGHGLGYKLHDDPYITNYGKRGKGERLFENKFIAIEPMFIFGGCSDVVFDEDGWTVRTKDGTMASHAEHDVLVTREGFEVLTDVSESEILD